MACLSTLHRASLLLRPPPRYLDVARPGSITSTERENLASFLADASDDIRLNVQMPALAMNYFDRYYALLLADGVVVHKQVLELYAIVCLTLAAKFYTQCDPSIEWMCKVTEYKFSADLFFAVEMQVIERLEWTLHVPLPHTFFEMIFRGMDTPEGQAVVANKNVMKWGCMLIDLTVFGYSFLDYSPLVVACGALLCAARLETVNDKAIVRTLDSICAECGITQGEARACEVAMMASWERCFPNSLKAEKQSFMPVRPDEDDCADKAVVVRKEEERSDSEERTDTTTPTSVIDAVDWTVR
ncbi:hypothetical protein AB1Y20_022770 [Prymnesium parvum]|uniref:Cyclin N-terminal domain-containing protein n=1 Tax=Prymnesium parvum TaxID=97485 RepID=A0AB34JKI0_PRYPA